MTPLSSSSECASPSPKSGPLHRTSQPVCVRVSTGRMEPPEPASDERFRAATHSTPARGVTPRDAASDLMPRQASREPLRSPSPTLTRDREGTPSPTSSGATLTDGQPDRRANVSLRCNSGVLPPEPAAEFLGRASLDATVRSYSLLSTSTDPPTCVPAIRQARGLPAEPASSASPFGNVIPSPLALASHPCLTSSTSPERVPTSESALEATSSKDAAAAQPCRSEDTAQTSVCWQVSAQLPCPHCGVVQAHRLWVPLSACPTSEQATVIGVAPGFPLSAPETASQPLCPTASVIHSASTFTARVREAPGRQAECAPAPVGLSLPSSSLPCKPPSPARKRRNRYLRQWESFTACSLGCFNPGEATAPNATLTYSPHDRVFRAPTPSTGEGSPCTTDGSPPRQSPTRCPLTASLGSSTLTPLTPKWKASLTIIAPDDALRPVDAVPGVTRVGYPPSSSQTTESSVRFHSTSNCSASLEGGPQCV